MTRKDCGAETTVNGTDYICSKQTGHSSPHVADGKQYGNIVCIVWRKNGGS